MATSAPISQMGLMEARRSLLIQLAKLDEFESELPAWHNIEGTPDAEVEKLTDQLIVMHANIMLTAEHIEELKAKA